MLRSREWTGSSAVSFAADGELREQSGFGATVVLDQNRIVGMVYGRMRVLLVERTESGRPWWCRIGRGSGGGCSCQRWGRRPPPGRLAAMGGLGEHSKASCVLGEALGASFYSSSRSVPRRPDKISGEPPLCSLQGNVAWLGMTARASGRECTAPGAGGEWEWLGRHRHGQRLSGGGGG